MTLPKSWTVDSMEGESSSELQVQVSVAIDQRPAPAGSATGLAR